MKTTKLLLALLSLLLVLSFTACQDEPAPTPAETTAQPTETTAPAPAEITLVDGGAPVYVVVRPEIATQAEIDAAIAIRTAIAKATGTDPVITTDWLKRGTEYDSSTREILVGGCGQPEAAAVREELAYGSYILRAEGNKFIITAWSDAALSLAVRAFEEAVDTHGFGGSLRLPGDFVSTGSANEMIDLLPAYTGGSVEGVINCADLNHMLYITETTPEAYDAYCQTLAASGFTLYTAREAADNRFATYTSEKNIVTAYYTACDKETRVIIEPISALPPRAEDTTTENDKYEPAVRMVGLEYNYSGDDYNQIGLMLIFRVPDGRLIVVDGGGYYEKNASILMKNLRELAPDPNNITIAAWVLTHAHGDHTGGFIRFANTYAGKVNVERVIYNFTTDAQYAKVDDSGRVSQARTAADVITDNVIRAHNGQVYHFGGATLEMLYTFEDFEPNDLPYHNTTSLIFRIAMGGQTVMVLGDAYTLSNGIMSAMYGSYLKSDIVQVTHHGYQGGSVQVYDLISADTAIWPGGLRNFDKLSARTENTHVLKISRDLYIAGDEVITLTLPYTVKNNNTRYAK